MLLSHYLPKILTALFGGLFIFAGVYTFGEPLLFDRLFICILIFTAFVCRKNINVLGVVVILVIQQLVVETAWTISELEFTNAVKALFYLASIALYWFIKYDKLSRLLLVALVLSLAAEFYWLAMGQSAPQVYWYVALLSSYAFVRHLFFMRVTYMQDWFKNRTVESINLDWQIYKLNAFFALLQFLMVIEYIIRGITGFNNLLYVWASYPYIVQLGYTYLIWVIFFESYKLIAPKLLRA